MFLSTVHQIERPLRTEPDYIALAMVAVLAVIVIAMVLHKRFASQKPVLQEPVVVAVPEAPKAVAPGSAGELKLHDVEPKIAAMLMAITADKIGKPLNELRFLSIKEVK